MSQEQEKVSWTEHDHKFIDRLNEVSVFLVREGIKYYYDLGGESLRDKLREEYAIQLWVDPIIDDAESSYLTRFEIKARGFQYSITNLHREKHGNDFYEFWVVNVYGANWTPMTEEDQHSIFYVTKTSDSKGEREVIQESNQFIPSFTVGEKKIIFPTDDETLYQLQAWKYPKSYENSDLDNVKIILKNGEYERVKLD